MRTASLYCAILLSGAAFGQSSDSPATFEVADVHVSAPSRFPFVNGPFTRQGRYEIRNATMVDMIAAAYGVDGDKVWGGPGWLENDRFDVIAKAPPGMKPEGLKTHFQALLADRFRLLVHNDTKPMPAYALTAGKHPLLKKSDGSGETGCKVTTEGFDDKTGAVTGTPTLIYTCHNTTMETFSHDIKDLPAAQQFLNGDPAVDRTELQGAWDFTLKYSLRGFGPNAGEIVTISDAIDRQLGLKLEPVKLPTSVIVVDSVNEKPTANVADVLKELNLSAPPTEFEVAVVKPTPEDFKGMRMQIEPNGHVNLQGVPLKMLMQQVWNLSDDMIAGAPKWMDEDRFDIVAKPPASAITSNAGTGPNSGPPVDIDTVLAMVKSLLAERFKLVTHWEDRVISAYTLTPGKPKMKKADPASRTKYKEGPATDGKDPRNKNPVLGRLVTCQNLTMAQFAEKLQGIAPGYIHSPVLDATGLEGGWDFTLSFSPAGAVGGRGGRGGDTPPAAPSNDVLAASDPNGAVTLFEAIERQMGVKLELQKRPVPILVIDHIDQKPTDN